MDKKEAIRRLRAYLSCEGLSAMVIPSNDPHFGEYIPNHYKCREWLSCFNGSAGTLVVTSQKAALWTDSRYFVQAEQQLEGTDISLMKIKMEGTPSIAEWLRGELEEGSVVALDENLFSYQEYVSYIEALPNIYVSLIKDPFSEIWEDRPRLEFHPIESMPVEIAGESVSSKHKRLCELLSPYAPFAYIISSLDEIAWLCNIRGKDVEYNPLVLSYCVVTQDGITLFASKEHLQSTEDVQVMEYSAFSDYISDLDGKTVKIFSSNRVTAKHYLAAKDNIVSDPVVGGAVNMMKSIKNSVELEGFRKAYQEDGVAWSKLLDYIKTNIVEKSEEEYYKSPVTEYDIVEKIIEFRGESPDYRGESFEPIVAYAANGALPHYSASKESSSIIHKRGFLLIDTGGQYCYGTTDTTRTIPVGPLTQEERVDYTAVLKGMVDLSMAKFPKGTRGAQLDILARGPVYSVGKRYLHGTGHGIGHYLCVHEGPQSIRMEENPVALEQGMVISNEPAIYVDGSHGIRIENTIVVKPSSLSDEFMEFETLTNVPIDESPVVWEMLSQAEIEWLYHHGFISQLSK